MCTNLTKLHFFQTKPNLYNNKGSSIAVLKVAPYDDVFLRKDFLIDMSNDKWSNKQKTIAKITFFYFVYILIFPYSVANENTFYF